jgi:hypothetical protein
VPINFVTVAGVSLTPACFPDRQYEDTLAARCLSNLLAAGFRRIEIDIYWDSSRQVWSLCPVQLGIQGSAFSTTAVTAIATPASTSATLASGQLTGQNGAAATSQVEVRQASDVRPSASSGSTGTAPSVASLSSASSTATLSADRTSTGIIGATALAGPDTASQNTMIEVGPYSCTDSINLELVTTALSQYLDNTETDLNATTRYLVINIHAAAPASNPLGSARQPADDAMPQGTKLLSSIISANASSYLYTPTDLADQRRDLNAAGNWYGASRQSPPDGAYFTIESNGGVSTSPDGWPTERYMELQNARRLLAGFGRIDPQMSNYNFTGDEASMFSAGYLTAATDANPFAIGAVTGTCFYNAGQQTVPRRNSSWAIAAVSPTSASQDQSLANLTACGISPFLNSTLSNYSAALNYTAYTTFLTTSSIWSWQPSEPRNATNTEWPNSEAFSCATLNGTVTGLGQGQWQASDCTAAHYAACRVGHTPYGWQISDQRGIYARVDAGCPDNTTFSVPRTALENTYLLSTWRDFLARPDNDADSSLLWLNFNSLDTPACWVVGQNSTCPYGSTRAGSEQGREIVVPTLAGVIVFVLAAATVLVKCAANRRSTKRRRRRAGDEGWDYEGVPS